MDKNVHGDLPGLVFTSYLLHLMNDINGVGA